MPLIDYLLNGIEPHMITGIHEACGGQIMEKETTQTDNVKENVLPIQEKVTFLTHHIDISLEDLHKHRKQNRTRASIIKILTILGSGIITILLGLQIKGLEHYFTSGALVIGAILTMFSAFEPFFNFRALWIDHEEAITRMYRLKNDVEFYLAGRP